MYAAVFSTFYNFLKEGEEGREIKKIMKETLKQNTQFKRWPQQEFVQLFPVFTNSSKLFLTVCNYNFPTYAYGICMKESINRHYTVSDVCSTD